jgi:chromate transporter
MAAAAFLAIFAFDVPFPLIVFVAGLVGWAATRAGSPHFRPGGHAAAKGGLAEADSLLGDWSPDIRGFAALRVPAVLAVLWLAPVGVLAATLGPDQIFARLGLFFSQLAAVSFGGAYAALAYVAQQAVGHYGWLAPGEMLDGLGLAETTPGPLILVVDFVGYLAAWRSPGGLPPWLAGTLGATLVAWVTLLPSFLWIFLGAPYAERLRGNAALAGALAAIGAAVVGVILNLAVWFALHVLFARVVPVAALGLSLTLPDLRSLDPTALALMLAALVAVFRFDIGLFRLLGVWSLLGLALGALGA